MKTTFKSLRYGAKVLFLSLSLSLLFVGCDNTTESDEIKIQQKSEANENCDFAVHGIYFDNGVPASSPHNMLHFPSWDSFEATIDLLDDQVDIHEDSFVIPNDHLSEDDLNDLEESSGFEEDQPLIDFEDSHEFTSLRSVLRIAEDAWLDASDQPGWSHNGDPDNTALVYGAAERSVYNPQNEVMICNIIYKEMVDGYLRIDISDPNSNEALAFANSGNNTQDVLDLYAGTVEEPTGITGEVLSDTTCLYKMKDVKRFNSNINSNRRIKAIHSISGFNRGGNFKWKSFTKNYKWIDGKFKKRRVSSWAGIYGEIHDETGQCGNLEPIGQRCTKKKRRRRKEVKRESSSSTPAIKRGTDYGALESRHKQRGETFIFPYD